MDLRPYVCKQCGGTINPATLQCEYCGTRYEGDSLKRLVITTRAPGQAKISAEVVVDKEAMRYDPEGVRDYALRELRNQLADGLLGYMRITTASNYRDMIEIIRGEVRVIEPEFGGY